MYGAVVTPWKKVLVAVSELLEKTISIGGERDGILTENENNLTANEVDFIRQYIPIVQDWFIVESDTSSRRCC